MIYKEQPSLISIIIPIYNAERSLEQTIDSVVSNGYDNLEVIAVDDGSTDGTSSLLRRMSALDSRIKMISVENGGVSRARNIALQHAKGEYIAFLDSDDWIMEGTLQGVLSCFDAHTDIVQFPIRRVFENGKTKPECYTQFRCDNQDEWMLHFFDKSLFRGLCNKMFRKEMLMGLSLCEDLKGGEDFMLLLDIVERRGRLSSCIEGAYFYRQHADSYCGSPMTEKKMRDETISFKRWFRMAGSQPCFYVYIVANQFFLQHLYLQYLQDGGARLLDVEADFNHVKPTCKQILHQIRLRLHLRALVAVLKNKYITKLF